MSSSADAFRLIRDKLAGCPPLRIDDPKASRASVALVLVPARPALEILLIVRAVDPRDPWSGQVGLPGGHQEERDKDRLAAALRETLEETGVRLRRRDLLGELDDLRPGWPGLPRIVIRPFVFGLSRRPAARARAEVADVLWAGLSALESSQGTVRRSRRGKAAEVACYRAGKRAVWGITRRILGSFLERVRTTAPAQAPARRGPSPPRPGRGARRA